MAAICRRVAAVMAALAVTLVGAVIERHHHVLLGAAVFVLGIILVIWSTGASQID